MFKNSGNFRHLLHITRLRGCSRKYGTISKGRLESSSTTSPLEISSARFGKDSSDGVILTLDSNKFAEKKQQRLDIGNSFFFTPRVVLDNESSSGIITGLRYLETSTIHFPPDIKVFPYYTIPPRRPRIAGELRLRVTSSDDVASFESGSDLLQTNGQPWSCSLYTISKFHPLLYEKLKEEGFVSDSLDTVLSALPKQPPLGSQVIYTLNDPFTVDFAHVQSNLSIITPHGVEKLNFFHPFTSGLPKLRPYAGSALARFERSTNPDHEGTRTVVLRFLEIIKPVECIIPSYNGHMLCPKAGELHQKSVRGVMQPWSLDLDSSQSPMVTRVLRSVWEA